MNHERVRTDCRDEELVAVDRSPWRACLWDATLPAPPSEEAGRLLFLLPPPPPPLVPPSPFPFPLRPLAGRLWLPLRPLLALRLRLRVLLELVGSTKPMGSGTKKAPPPDVGTVHA